MFPDRFAAAEGRGEPLAEGLGSDYAIWENLGTTEKSRFLLRARSDSAQPCTFLGSRYVFRSLWTRVYYATYELQKVQYITSFLLRFRR
jgi:hypothetical protein